MIYNFQKYIYLKINIAMTQCICNIIVDNIFQFRANRMNNNINCMTVENVNITLFILFIIENLFIIYDFRCVLSCTYIIITLL